jgi:hypothetical protein
VSPVADRVRAHRARRAAGRRVLVVEVDEIQAIDVLEAARLLPPLHDHDQHEIEQAVARLLELLAGDLK